MVLRQRRRGLRDVEQRVVERHALFARDSDIISVIRRNVLEGSIYVRDVLIDPESIARESYRDELRRLRSEIDARLLPAEIAARPPSERGHWQRLQGRLDHLKREGLGVAAISYFRAPEVLVAVSLTMVTIVLVGSLIGMSLPFLLTRLGLDPATASAPLITSIADISGVLIYFSIATWLLRSAAAG